MIPLSKFHDILCAHRDQFNHDMQELVNAAQLLGSKPNYFTMDENGMFHAQASGTMDEVIRALKHHLEKLEKIQSFKEGRQ